MKSDRDQGRDQALDGEIIEERQFALFLQARLHDTPGILVKHPHQFNGGGGGVDGTFRKTAHHQLQGAGVVCVSVGNQDRVQCTARLFDLAQTRELVRSQAAM